MPRINSTNRSVNDELKATRMQNINQDIDDLYANWNDRLKVFKAISWTALKIDIGAWNFLVGTTRGQYAWWTDISVTNTATNYVMIDSAWTIQTSTSWRDVNYARLAIVVCSWWVITSISDYRTNALWWNLSNSWNRFVSSPQSMTNTNVYTITHNLAVTQSDVEAWRYSILLSYTNTYWTCWKYQTVNSEENTEQSTRSSWTPTGIAQRFRQANSVKIYCWGTSTNVRVIIRANR